MSNRTVTVALKASTSDYEHGMSRAEASTARLSRSADSMKTSTSRGLSVLHRASASTGEYERAMGRAETATTRLSRATDTMKTSSSHGLSTLGRASALAGGIAGSALGALVVSSVKSAATFETTMRQIAVATGAPASSIKSLSALAIKMGADTTFSAQDASEAMLELAKSGLNEAQIKAGALASTLTLASAGGLQLGDAAGFITSGLSLFSLKADQSAAVAAALAGAANAAKGDVSDFGLALSQVGPGAAQAGLSLQQTTAVLALFAKNGILGSDAGTSLKTMLASLVPQTTQQANAMKHLGLNFVDAKGNFRDVATIAQQLHDKLGGLSEAQRTTALNTIFGSDASRAAAILMKEGAAGVRDMTRATSDKTQADKLAQAATSGTAGALSQLSGSIDTAKLELGQALAPIVRDLADHMTVWANELSTDVIPSLDRFIKGMENGTGPGGQFAAALDEVGSAVGTAWHIGKDLFGFMAAHPTLFKTVAEGAAALAVALKAQSVSVAVMSRLLPGVLAEQRALAALGGVGAAGAAGGAAAGAGGAKVVPGIPNAAVIPLAVTIDALARELHARDANADLAKELHRLIGLAGQAATPADLRAAIAAADAIAKRDKVTPLGHGKYLTDPSVRPNLTSQGVAAADLAADLRKRLAVALTPLATSSSLAKMLGASVPGLSEGVLHAEQTMQASIDALSRSLRANGDSFDANSQKGRANREALRDSANAVRGHITALAMQGVSMDKLQPIYDADVAKLRAVATRAGLTKDQFARLAQQMGLTPGTVQTIIKTPGVQQALAAIAQVNARLGALHNKTVSVNVVVNGVNTLDGVTTKLGHLPMAGGGEVRGPGTGTSDSILTRLSNGEFVVKADVAQANLGFLSALNSGQVRPALYRASSAPTAAASGPAGAAAGGLHIHGDINVTKLPGERDDQAVVRELRDLTFLLSA